MGDQVIVDNQYVGNSPRSDGKAVSMVMTQGMVGSKGSDEIRQHETNEVQRGPRSSVNVKLIPGPEEGYRGPKPRSEGPGHRSETSVLGLGFSVLGA